MSRPVLQKIAIEARKAMPHEAKQMRNVSICYDRASSHTADVSLEFLTELYEGDIIEKPLVSSLQSPVLNLSNVAQLPHLERTVDVEGAETKEEIRSA